MSRKKRASKRKVKVDLKFNNLLIAKLINKIMVDGKKTVAEKIVYNALDIVADKIKKDAIEIFEKAIDNIKPEVEVKSRRIGGATYQIPVEVPHERQVSMSYSWLINYARARSGKAMSERLALEIMDAYNNVGSCIKKKEDTHKMAEANRAFAHFRW